MPSPNALQLTDCPAGVARDAVYPLNTQAINNVGQSAANNEGIKPCYRSVVASYAPYATATDIVQLLNPSGSTKTVRVTRVNICGASTAASMTRVALLKRSATDTGGTSTGATCVAMDSQDPACQATVLSWSVVPGALGTLVGSISSFQMLNAVITTGGSGWPDEQNFGAYRGTKPCVLHAGEALCVNLGGAAVAGGLVMDIEIEWTEETPPIGVAV